MIVDGLIKKELLGENQIIDTLGFSNIFQKTSSIPSNGQFSDIGKIQENLQNSEILFNTKIVDNNLQANDDCSGGSEIFGAGKIVKV